ncbi:hypothetical protein SUGI_0239580 [Cryptomeria japonica]|nr:hypothetical protein SUGI_0239580 [Cryptomeria japonica]
MTRGHLILIFYLSILRDSKVFNIYFGCASNFTAAPENITDSCLPLLYRKWLVEDECRPLTLDSFQVQA